MCWYGYTKKECVERIATDNIPVTKLVNIGPFNIIKSYYHDFDYKLNVNYKTNEGLTLRKDQGYKFITIGFHSYSTNIKFIFNGISMSYDIYDIFNKKTCTNCSVSIKYNNLPIVRLPLKSVIDGYFVNLAIADCIIPKGAHYFLNHHGEYVSNAIKIINVYKIK